MNDTKQFSVGAVISVGTGRLASSIGEVYEVLNWMLDDNLMTHQLPAASRAVEQELLDEHPWLVTLNLPDGGGADFTDAVMAATEKHGPTVAVSRSDNPDWRRGNAIQDLVDIAGDRAVFAVRAD